MLFYAAQQAYNQATQINQPCKGRSDGDMISANHRTLLKLGQKS